MTLGERVQVLEKLDSELSKVLPQIRGTRALGKSGIRLQRAQQCHRIGGAGGG
jgi:hypothetical protein